MSVKTTICPACNIDYADHLGLIPTCNKLQHIKLLLKRLLDASLAEHYLVGNMQKVVTSDMQAYQDMDIIINQVKEELK